MKSIVPPLLLSVIAFSSDLIAADLTASANYLEVVQRYADAIVEHGTDNYGPEHSGMLLSIMDRKNLKPFNAMPKAPSGIRNGDRVTPYGSNVNLDQNLYRFLYALSEITGDRKYREAADSALAQFLKVAPSPQTSLFAWGEHLCWDLKADAWGTHASKAIHEPKRPTVLFDKFYELNSASVIDYCDGLWEHQIYTSKDGKKDGNFSRHTAYDRHDPRSNFDFPKEGGYFIHDWARAYQKTGESRFLDYIDVLASRYTRKIKKTTKKLLEFDAVRGFADTSASVSLAIDCHHAAEIVELGPVRKKLLELAAAIDEGLQALPHNVKKFGFVQYVTVKDDYKLYEHKQHGGYSFTWNMKYGCKTTAMLGLLFHTRHSQLNEGGTKTRYREMMLQAADKYLSSEPEMDDRPWPVELGTVLFLQIAAYELTGKEGYRARAEHLANVAIAAYWPDDKPLPKADPQCNHYENVTRADTLALALLKLHAIENSVRVQIPISDIDR